MELSHHHVTCGQNRIVGVHKGSLAEKMGVQEGDILLSVDGVAVHDIIEYRYLISEEFLSVDFLRQGKPYTLNFEKEYDEDLGILFRNPLIDKANHCKNNCVFCFIDQLPPNMRKTLYFKDDDSRLSFLQGNFITLTNLAEEEIKRMIQYRISPINISVHTTDPALRIQMLKNPKAGKVLEIMGRFYRAGIQMNAQIVAIPGLNDGEALKRTFLDLMGLHPQLESVAVVPVGLTKHREGLPKLSIYTETLAQKLIEDISEMQKMAQKKVKSRFIYPSDEFYVVAKKEIPKETQYEGYPQIENGVGLLRMFEEEVNDALIRAEESHQTEPLNVVTGKLAFEFMQKMVNKVQKKCQKRTIAVHAIDNHFFGETITVAGLLTGRDIYEQLKNKVHQGVLLIPQSMLKYDERIFLDDMTVEELSAKLQLKINVVKVSGHDFVQAICHGA